MFNWNLNTLVSLLNGWFKTFPFKLLPINWRWFICKYEICGMIEYWIDYSKNVRRKKDPTLAHSRKWPHSTNHSDSMFQQIWMACWCFFFTDWINGFKLLISRRVNHVLNIFMCCCCWNCVFLLRFVSFHQIKEVNFLVFSSCEKLLTILQWSFSFWWLDITALGDVGVVGTLPDGIFLQCVRCFLCRFLLLLFFLLLLLVRCSFRR